LLDSFVSHLFEELKEKDINNILSYLTTQIKEEGKSEPKEEIGEFRPTERPFS